MKIYNVFYILLPEKNTIRKKQINELISKLKPEFNTNNNKKYKIETIKNSIIYTKEADKYLLDLHYLIF